MASLSLKISLDGGRVVKTMQFDPSTTVFDACRIIREKILEANASDPKEYGLFIASEDDPKKGIWLEASRSLDYYMLRNGDLIEYNRKLRNLRVRMLDGTVKTLLVDDSQVVANLMVVICTKIGITNYDEYGLVREEPKDEPDPCEKPNYGTLTLRRKHQEKERDAKMEQLRRKLRTDDEVNWVENAKTLREQGIEGSETLLLRRKLFFSDRNVDSRDPVQLNLLYVQARDAILDGTHPVTQDKACEFAGLQCQIQFGEHKDDKHTHGFLDLKEFLPASYVKVKGIEKKVFQQHRRHGALPELEAKVLYTKSARDLSTYGVAFFLVKEKMKGKNKLVPRLLGVTKDSVLRLDERTKEILQTWPLTTVRRWCASANTFTLDFGDYSDQYYSVQTTEAEQILQVIAGYIDIIVRKQRAKDHLGIEGDEGSAMLEDSVSPSKANIIQHDTFKTSAVNTESVAKPAVIRPGGEGAKPFAVAHLTGAQQTTVSGQIITGHAPPSTAQGQQTRVTSVQSEPQRALLSTLAGGQQLLQRTQMHLQRAVLETPVGNDAASVRWRGARLASSRAAVTTHLAAMNAATAQVVTLTSGPTEEVDHTAVGEAITTITTNLPEMTKGVEMIAALMEDQANGDKLLDATRRLCSAFSELLKAAEPEAKEPRQSLLNAASRVGEASTTVLHTIGDDNEYDKETQDILLSLAKAVANTTAALVLKAKNVAAACKDDQQLQNQIITAATNCALATSQLVACAKVVAPTLHNPACRSQLIAAAQNVADAVDKLVSACRLAPPAAQPVVEHLTAAAQRVSEELQRLLDHCQLERRPDTTVEERYVQSVMTASELVTSANDATEMVRQARALGQATAHLITNIKTEAERAETDGASQRRLIAAAKLLADATARMVEAARMCASAPQDREKQENLRRLAEEVKYIATDYWSSGATSSSLSRLRGSARAAVLRGGELTAQAQQVEFNNQFAQDTLIQETESLAEEAPRLGAAAAQPPTAANQLDLLAACDSYLQSATRVTSAARAAVPAVSGATGATALATATHHFSDACADLKSAVGRTRASSKGLELDAAAEILKELQLELDELQEALQQYELQPLPGQTEEWATSHMTSSSRAAASSTAALATAARLRDPAAAARAAPALAAANRDLAAGVRAAAVLHSHAEDRDRLISSGRQVVTSSLTLVETVRTSVSRSEAVDMTEIVNIAKNISESLQQTMEAASSPSELDVTMENIHQTLTILDSGEFPPTDQSYGALQTTLKAAAGELSEAAENVCEAPRGSLPGAARRLGGAYNALVQAALEAAGLTENVETRSRMVSAMKSVTINSTKLLATAKSVSQDLERPNSKNQLSAAARAVTDSINQLVDVCTSAAPGQKECEAAILRIKASRPLLTAPSQPISDLGYHACLDAAVTSSKGLSEGMSGLAGAVKSGATDGFAKGVTATADAVIGLVECTAQAAYLVAVSDPTSSPARQGLVDQAMFSRAAHAIHAACDQLADANTDQSQVLSAATEIAKHTSALCNACRMASGRTSEPQDKRHFVHAAKEVANSTAKLVKEIKALDQDYNQENRSRCAAACIPLREAVSALVQFADAPEFASVPARISPAARQSQEALLHCGREIITVSCAMLDAARALALAPADRPPWQALAAHSKQLSDTIKELVTNMRDKAPGQRECAAALETISSQARRLQRATLDHTSVAPEELTTAIEQLERAAEEMQERLEPLRAAAVSQAENLGHAVLQLVSYTESLSSSSCLAASALGAGDAREQLLQHSHTVLESLAAVTGAARAAGGNPRATQAHSEVEESISSCRSALQELGGVARDVGAQRGAVQPLLELLQRDVARLTDSRMSLVGSYDEAESFVDYQTRMVATAKDIARLASDMTAKSVTDPTRLLELGGSLCARYGELARDARGAAAVTTQVGVAERLRTSVAELGEACASLVRAAGACRLAAHGQQRTDVARTSILVGEKVVCVLSALQAGGRGAQACIDAAATVAACIGDLDTTILFASSGTLTSDRSPDSFSLHREGILQTARRLVEDTKALVGGAAGDQDQLATAARSAVSTIVQLCEVVKQGAMSLGPGCSEPQVLVLHAARGVAAALRDLASATAAASGKHHGHPDMQKLKHAAKRDRRRSYPTTRVPVTQKRLSYMQSQNDSETDVFQSDQEEELIRLLDYSSQDDDVSPTIFYDNCEEIVTYIETFLLKSIRKVKDSGLDDRYNLASKNSLVDMDWRVLKYGENILLGEIKAFVDIVVDVSDKAEVQRKAKVLVKMRASTNLDNEMKRLSQVIEDLDTEEEIESRELKSPVFKVRKVSPVIVESFEEAASKEPKTPEKNKDESTELIVKPDVAVKDAKLEFWKVFQDDTELWTSIAKRNLEKMEETRRELERFSGHELVLHDIQNERDKYEKEKERLQTFIDDVDKAKTSNLEYDKKYEEMVIKLIEFAKRDAIYTGFDPLIVKLKELANIEIERRRKINVHNVININNIIDITNCTYEELCVLEKYNKELIKKYKTKVVREKENCPPRDHSRSPSLIRETPSPSYHRNVILNIHSQENMTKNVNKYSNVTQKNVTTNSKVNNRNSQTEIFDLTRTYPMEYYANNWWRIYEDILQSRENQFGSIDNWWQFYETILNKDSSDEQLQRIKAVVQYRNNQRRSNSRMEEQLKMLDEIKNDKFQESEAVTTSANDSLMVTNVTSLLKTVKSVEDEHTRGNRALEATIEAIAQEIEVLCSSSPPTHPATPEELVRCTRAMTSATARAVAAGNAGGQDQLTAAANAGRKCVVDLLHAAKGAAFAAETSELRTRTLSAGRETAEAYRALLAGVLAGDRASLPELSRRVAHATADIVAAAELLKGSDWVDPEDPTVIAESELLSAAASIDAAARKLEQLRPRAHVTVQEADESLNFDQMILEAAKCIITATSALVRAACVAQRELIDQGKVARRPTSSSDDGQWSEGLVSAARLVAAAAHALVEAANALVQGAGSEERLISSARQVASSTAQLLVACKVKADPSSESTRRLQAAGAEVIRSTDNLVRAARDAIQCEDERSLVLNRRMVGGIAQEIDARSEVLRIEKELEEARGRLTAIRQAKYRLRDTDGEETDDGGSPDHRMYRAPTSSFANTTYSPNSTYSANNATNLSQHVSQLNQSIYGQNTSGLSPTSPGLAPTSPGLLPTSPGLLPTSPGLAPTSPVVPTSNWQASSPGYQTGTWQTPGQAAPGYQNTSQNQATSTWQSSAPQNYQNGYNQTQQVLQRKDESQYTVQSPTFSSFRPHDDQKQNYEGFTTRYETKLYDTPRPIDQSRTEEHRQYEYSNQTKHYEAPRTPLSPKFNARELKFEDIYSPLKKSGDGIGQTFTEHQKQTEAIPGGTKHSEYTIKSESYSSHPKVTKTVIRPDLPFTTSTPSKVEEYNQYQSEVKNSSELVKVQTPDSERISSPYGKEIHSVGGPNYRQETMTEVKDIPNGTQKIITTKIYSSSPVSMTTTNTKFEPVKLEGIDELSKSFDNESKYSTLDSRFNTLESKMSSDTSRSFMRPSDFQSTDYQVTKVKKPSELVKEIDNLDKKFSKQTITSETIERKSVMTSSHKSETSSTVTKKFGNA